MATVDYYKYSYLEPQGFWPYETRTKVFWGDWGDKAVVATAAPFNLSTEYRTLTVSEVRVSSEPGTPVGQYSLEVIISHPFGVTPIIIYYLMLGVISP